MTYRSFVPYVFVVLLLIIASSCSNNPTDTKHEHEAGGPENISYTIYSENLELFVEFKPLVVGSISKFATHLTVTGERFTALSAAKVTVSLLVGNSGIKQSVDKTDTPGIFRLSLEPKTGGMGKIVFDIETKGFTDQITIDNVFVFADDKAAMSAPMQHENAGNISYLKEQAWKTEFANAPVQRQNFYIIIKTSGQVLSAAGDEEIITAGAAGIVSYTGNNTIAGTEVNSQTNLFSISGGDLTSGNVDAKFKEAKAHFEKAEADHDRAKELIGDKIISEKDFLDTKLKFENAKVAFDALSKNYSGMGQMVRSPIQGFVKSVLVSQGQYIEQGTPLAIISKNKKLILQANISQKYFSKLSSITDASFKTTSSDVVYDTKALNGKVISYGKSAGSNSPFIPISFEFDNPGNIIPGSVAEVFLKSSPIPDALVIPTSALTEEQGTFFVYLQTAGESFEKREVKLAASDGLNVQVISGLSEGERIVTKGAYQVKLASASGSMPEHGHEH